MISLSVSIFEKLGVDPQGLAAEFIRRNIRPCISGSTRQSSGQENSSRLGGSAYLPLSRDYPRDKQGRNMEFVGQLNFEELPFFAPSTPPIDGAIPTSGILSLFWNASRDFSNPKDRNSFSVVWSAQDLSFRTYDSDDLSGEKYPSVGQPVDLDFTLDWSVPGDVLDWQGAANSLDQSADDSKLGAEKDLINRVIDSVNGERAILIFGHADKQFSRLREIAAFASNGISWSPVRSKDSCYEHLVAASNSWILLWKITSLKECAADPPESIYLLINKDDLATQNLEKAWLLVDK